MVILALSPHSILGYLKKKKKAYVVHGEQKKKEKMSLLALLSSKKPRECQFLSHLYVCLWLKNTEAKNGLIETREAKTKRGIA